MHRSRRGATGLNDRFVVETLERWNKGDSECSERHIRAGIQSSQSRIEDSQAENVYLLAVSPGETSTEPTGGPCYDQMNWTPEKLDELWNLLVDCNKRALVPSLFDAAPWTPGWAYRRYGFNEYRLDLKHSEDFVIQSDLMPIFGGERESTVTLHRPRIKESLALDGEGGTAETRTHSKLRFQRRLLKRLCGLCTNLSGSAAMQGIL